MDRASAAKRRQEAHLGPTWAQLGPNLGHLGANLGPREAKSDCIFTVFFKVCMKIEFLLPSAAREAPRRVNLGQLGANLGQLSANFGSTWPWVLQLGIQKTPYVPLFGPMCFNFGQLGPT